MHAYVCVYVCECVSMCVCVCVNVCVYEALCMQEARLSHQPLTDAHLRTLQRLSPEPHVMHSSHAAVQMLSL